MQNNPPRRHNRDHQHDGHFPEFTLPRPDTRYDPQSAYGPENEASAEHECEIEYARFENPHDRFLHSNLAEESANFALAKLLIPCR